MTTVDAREDQYTISFVTNKRSIRALTGGVTNMHTITESMAQTGKVICF